MSHHGDQDPEELHHCFLFPFDSLSSSVFIALFRGVLQLPAIITTIHSFNNVVSIKVLFSAAPGYDFSMRGRTLNVYQIVPFIKPYTNVLKFFTKSFRKHTFFNFFAVKLNTFIIVNNSEV